MMLGFSRTPRTRVQFLDGGDYFKGVKPSDLRKLSDRDLFLAGCRLAERVDHPVGTPQEMALCAEALAAVYAEAKARRTTLWAGKENKRLY